MNSIFKTRIGVTSMRERRYLKRRVKKRLKMSDSSCFLNDFKRAAHDTFKLPTVDTLTSTEAEL